MKVVLYVLLFVFFSSLFSACTPTAMETDTATVVSTGDDQSVRPDNEKD